MSGQSAGPVLIGLSGPELSQEECDWLRHPAVGGVVLFSRNFESPAQLAELNLAIRERAAAQMLICVDHEGGRVQRFRQGFTRLPPLALLGRMYAAAPAQAGDFAYRHARVMATEVLLNGLDLSFAPVLDIDGASQVIGDRALSPDPGVVIALGEFYLAGMHDAGMKTCGKHFPGHGSVAADSHTHDAIDRRDMTALEDTDIRPFRALLDQLDALMMAHVIYPGIDPVAAGYSPAWVKRYLRGELGYTGTVFSDDLGMHAAFSAGGLRERMRASLDAGCDAVLVCQPSDVRALLDSCKESPQDATPALERLRGRLGLTRAELDSVVEWRDWKQSLEELENSQWA